MKRFLFVLFALGWVPETSDSWGGSWAPLQWVTELLEWHGLKIPTFDLILLAMLAMVKDKRPKARTKGMERALWLCGATVVVWCLWGVIQGGNTYQMQFQVYCRFFLVLLAMVLSKVLVTSEDFFALGKVIWGVSLYRAAVCVFKYLTIVLPGGEPPFVCTTHEDSVVFVTGIFLSVTYLIERRKSIKRGTMTGMLLAIVVMLAAIQFNNRRLAWVSLVSSFLLLYFALPKSPLKSKINKRLLYVLPFVAVYVVVGTGRPEKIFAPLKSLSSVGDSTDASTRSRDNENMGLLVTLGAHPFMGTGWGIEYIEVDASLSAGVSGFIQYRYMPHNSVLAALAFTGAIGFAFGWLMYPIGIYLCNRSYRIAVSPATKMVAIGSVCEAVAVVNQGWGDLGLFARVPMMGAAVCFAAAIRLPSIANAESAAVLKARSTPPAANA